MFKSLHQLLGLLLLPLAGIIWSNSANAWSHHDLVTQSALSKMTEIQNREVTVTSFEQLLTDLKISSALDFNKSLQIHKNYSFTPHLQELPGQNIALAQVLSTYSDEPDWGMDQQLFTDDQYPELWKSEYTYMGGKTGTPSQAFRHMYWRELYILHPLQSFKLPHVFSAMGEAPSRAKLFIELAHRAQATGHPYWAARFTANALHYLEDAADPFHAAQTPTKKFLMMPFTNFSLGSGFKNYIPQVLHIISYYHFAFEDYVGAIMDLGTQDGDPEGLALSQALAESNSPSPLATYNSRQPELLIKEIAEVTTARSAQAGRAGLDFFPQISTPYAVLVPEAMMDKAWWEEVYKLGKENSAAKQSYFKVVTESFETLGTSIRDLVSREFDSSLNRKP